jgi:hypothetical protein
MLLLALCAGCAGRAGQRCTAAAVWRHRRHPLGPRCQGTRPINFEVDTAKRPKRSSGLTPTFGAHG